MADKSAVAAATVPEKSQHVLPCKKAPPVYPYIFHRIYLCRHDDEYVKVSKWADRKAVVHTIIPPPDRLQEEDSELQYTLERCRYCATMLREQQQSLQGAGREAWMRPTAAHQGECMGIDGGLMREARTGFEVALRQLNRISCCTGKQEDGREVVKQVADDDSVRVGKFLHGRREVRSPSPTLPVTEECLVEAWPREEVKEPEDSWADCGARRKGHQRKDSAYEASQSTGSRPEAFAPVPAKTEEPPKLTTNVYSDLPRTPMAIKLGPKQDLDWLRYSYFVQNNQLSFDDIAELVARSTGKDETTRPKNFVEGRPSAIDREWLRNGALRLSACRPETADPSSRRNVSPLQERYSGAKFGAVNGERFDRDISRDSAFGKWDSAALLAHEQARPRISHTTSYDSHLRRSKSLAVRPQTRRRESADQTTKKLTTSGCPRDLGQTQDHVWMPEVDVAHSCFSSDSSQNSVNWPCKLEVSADKPKAPATSWWKPKWKKEGIPTVPAAVTALSTPKENSFSLWKRVSKTTPRRTLDKESKAKVGRKLQHKSSPLSSERSSPHASDVRREPESSSSNLHPAFRNPPLRPDPPSPTRTPGAMRTPYRPNSGDNTTSKAAKHSQRSSANAAKSERRGSTPRLTKAAPRVVHRPYKPSPLKTMTQVTSLDVNKGLPPLPPEARPVRPPITHQASSITVKEVAGVRKVAIRKVNESVDETTKEY
ncbi:hypothetical protein TW65_03036 [Stemphylium lycopersici]|uniref:Uncharacterized protein n=1 Tax=Stemphylium lycopersici TaxID=183478 RepID=A0A364NBN1_STELY|nr:hypothetical protein TW65_03036 [Stemphylium lycopersici]RAR14471.1 hypothetical protein DDE83_002239 [Stemphylium lycopersici]